MPITISCPNPACDASSVVGDSFDGRSVKCKKCGKPFVAQPTFDGQKNDTKKSRPVDAENPFPMLPAEFGRYRVLRMLGKGGMGAVYLAEDSQLGRQVALKLPFFDPQESPARIERFSREARSAAALHHPNICTVFDAGEINGRPFITMAYLPGTPLEQQIGGPVPMAQLRAAEIARKIAQALEHAHIKGTIHRDLKPANVMLMPDGEPVVMDFGLAKLAAKPDPNEAKLTRDGGIVGTPSYMSPEQVRGDNQSIGAATDIYSLGVLLFEMVAGTTPYSGPMGAVLGQILVANVPHLQEFRPDAHARLDAICQKAMAKEPHARFRNMAEFSEALGEYLAPAAPSVSRSSVLAPPIPIPEMVNVALVAEEETEEEEIAPEPVKNFTRRKAAAKSRGWHPGIFVGIAVGILGLGLLAAWAGGVFKVKTKEGTIELTGLAEDSEVFVDGEKVTVTWAKGKQTAELRVKQGTHKVEVRKDGFTAFGEEVTLEDKGRKVLSAKLTKPVAMVSEKPEVATPAPPAKLSDRLPSRIQGGEWRIEGKDLVQTKPGAGIIVFGNPAWTDYDLTFETRTDVKPGYGDGAQGGCNWFRVQDMSNYHVFTPGAWGCTLNEVVCIENGKWIRDVNPLGDKYEPGRWYKVAIRVRGDKIRCSLDGKDLFVYTDARCSKGQIGFAAYVGLVRWRNIQVVNPKGVVLWDGLPDVPAATPEPKPAAKASEFVPLFNGKDLTGWTSTAGTNSKWQMTDGVLTCTGPTDYLFTDRTDYEDFHLRFEAKVNTSGNSGIYFRSQKPAVASTTSDGHYEAQISNRADQPKTGSLFGLVKVDDVLVPPDTWFTYEVIAEGNQIRLLVNGKQTAEYTDTKPDRLRKGHVALQCWKHRDDETVVAYRNVEIKELAAAAVEPPKPPAKADPFQEKPQPDDDGFAVGTQISGTTVLSWGPPEKRESRNGRLSFTVTKRSGNKFSLEGGNGWQAEGKTENGTVSYTITVSMIQADVGKSTFLGLFDKDKGTLVGIYLTTNDPTYSRQVQCEVVKPRPMAMADPFQEKSVWASAALEVEHVLTVTERKGDTFKARFVGKDYWDRAVSGTIMDGKVVWLAKDVVAVKGNQGLDNYGTLVTDEKGERIDFVYKSGNDVKGMFTLRLQAKK